MSVHSSRTQYSDTEVVLCSVDIDGIVDVIA
jgi:hypothetical protein